MGDPRGPEIRLKWFNTAAFAQPVFGAYGNSGRNILRGPGINNLDLALFKNFDLVRGVHGITVPTLYVWSTGDVALAREGAEATRRHVAGPYRFEVLDGECHQPFQEVPETFNARVDAFWREV